MPTEFIEDQVLKRIRTAARLSRRPGKVAVAYFAKGAADLLPLKKNSKLVVDASEATVRSGGTSPSDLIKLSKKGVRVFSVQNLHAKVFVFGGKAFIGSSNVSMRSADTLKEAVVQISERHVVKAARDFVGSLCLQELGLEALDRLKKLYRPPRFPVGKARKRKRNVAGRVRAKLSACVNGSALL